MFDKLIDMTDTDASFFTILDRLVFSASFSLTLYWGVTVIYIFIYTVQSIFAGIRIFQHLNLLVRFDPISDAQKASKRRS